MNNTGTLHLRDKEFRQEHAGECELLIKTGSGRLSYAIVNSREKKLNALYDSSIQQPLQESLEVLKAQNDYLNYPFKKTKLAIESCRFTFIPAEFYSPGSIPVYQNFVHSTRPSRTIINLLKQAGSNLVASVDKTLTDPLQTAFPSASIHIQAESLIEGSLTHFGDKPAALVLQFNGESFEAVYIKNGQFTFYNIFQISNADDFNYFLLLMMKQLQMESSLTEVVLTGEIEKYSENYRRTIKYFNKIHFSESPALFGHSDIFGLVPPHQFFSLLSLNYADNKR